MAAIFQGQTPAGACDWPLAGRGNFGQPSEREVVTDRAMEAWYHPPLHE